jgi:hypothetical protein
MNFRRSALRSLVFAAACVAWLTGCATYALVGPGEVFVHSRLEVTLDRAWNRQVYGVGNVWPESWTQNGPLIDMLIVAPAIENGNAIVLLPERQLREFPRFRAGGTTADLVEMVQGSLAKASQAGDFVPIVTEPARIAGQDGVRFEFKFGTGGDGGVETDRHALGYAFEYEKRLYLILFHAAEIHYFAAMRPAVEAIVGSARLPQAKTASR